MTKQQCKKVAKKVLKKHKIKVIKTRKWYTYFIRQAAKRSLLSAGYSKAADSFLSGRTVFLTIGNRRYLFTHDNNFGSTKKDLIIITHELKHLFQEKKLGQKEYKTKYTNARHRAIMEGAAYAVSYLMAEYLGVKLRVKFNKAFKKAYWVGDTDAAAAKRIYDLTIDKKPNQKAVQEVVKAIEAVVKK